ncbi:MAG: hypothetical protein ACPLPW_08435 [bacterium]
MQIKFTAQTLPCYQGFDGNQLIKFLSPGVYEVSAEKAAQLLRDFPADFEAVEEAESPAEPSVRKKRK